METRFAAVQRILDTATDQGGPGDPYHQGLGRFWQSSRDEFIATVVYDQQVIVVGNPDESALIKALKGLPPFDGTMFAQMPLAKPAVSAKDIDFIAKWIQDGCPYNDPRASKSQDRWQPHYRSSGSTSTSRRLSIAEKIRTIEPITSIDKLKEHLQLAIEIEHATIPPYLTALYTLQSARNAATYRIIQSIVIEEMLHLSLVCNLLNAVDGQPRLAYPGFIPEYPTKLPQEDADFEVSIEACSDDALATFQKIEFPDFPLPVRARSEVGYRTIGEFYHNVQSAFCALNIDPGPAALFNGNPIKQLSTGYGFPHRGRLVAVTDLSSALEAIGIIVDQGEGSQVPGDSVPAKDRPHYFNFTDIRLHNIHGDNGQVLLPHEQFDPTGVWPMIKNPRFGGRRRA